MTQPPLSPGDIIREYLEGCADFDTGFDEFSLLAAFGTNGYTVITTAYLQELHAEIQALENKLKDTTNAQTPHNR